MLNQLKRGSKASLKENDEFKQSYYLFRCGRFKYTSMVTRVIAYVLKSGNDFFIAGMTKHGIFIVNILDRSIFQTI